MTPRTTSTACPACGYGNDAGEPACGMCGALLGAPPPAPGPGGPYPGGAYPVAPHPAGQPGTPARPAPSARAAEAPAGPPPQLVALGAGLLLAPVFSLTPWLQYMAWFLGSLTHESGHSVMGWVFGFPSFPAIRLDGHAMARHGPQWLPLALVMWAFIGWAAWRLRAMKRLAIALGALAVIYPLLAFTDAHEVLFLLGGHAGELTFAGVFFWRALAGGFTDGWGERIAYATVAWMLLGRNLLLSWGLMFSASERAWYASSGSFGLTNDYLRLSGDVLGCSLELVAAGMGLVALAVLPIAWLTWRFTGD